MKKLSIGILPLLLLLFISNLAIAQAPAGYYKDAEGKNKKTLLIALRDIVGSHKTVSYAGLWDVFKTSDVRADGKVWDMYSTSNFTPGQKQCGNYSKVGDCYNREHSFPKSWFDDASPMYSEAYHLYPTDGKVNGQRSNHPYGECANGVTLPSTGSIQALGRLGSSTFPGYSGTVFEPVDEYKGDFARSYFYMAAAYQNRISGWNSPMLAGNDYPCYTTWAVNLLLKWSRQDPVSQKEINRNNVVASYQNNRNPFIDHPELAEYIWGTKQGEGWVPGGVTDPTIISPVDGQQISIGGTSLNREIAYTLVVKGQALTNDVSVSISGNNKFSTNSTTISKDLINSTNGAQVSIKYVSPVAGTDNATMTINSSEVSLRLNLTATAYDGIPALEATEISLDSFLARWVDVTGSGDYSLSLYKEDGVTLINGYPISVTATAGQYKVQGLAFETIYHYQLSQGELKSNLVKVKTAAPIRVLSLIYPDKGLIFNAAPNTESSPIQVEVFSEYVSEMITASVTEGFEISLDKTNWSNSLQLYPEGESFYIRLKANPVEGTYLGLVSLRTETLDGDEVDLKGIVSTPRTFFEDFETAPEGGYYNDTKVTEVCSWKMQDAGFWGASTDRHNGALAVRFGKSSSSSITMAEDKLNGAGRISFFAGLFGTDGNANIEISYSTDGGANWVKVSDASVSQPLLNEYTYEVNITAPVRFKIEQVSGGRLNIDDISINDYSSVNRPSFSNTFDAYSSNGSIIIESEGKDIVTIYSLDALPVYQATPEAGKTSVDVQAGVYVVVSGDNAKKVVVK